MEPEHDAEIAEIEKRFQERFVQLPKVVQNAITSADIEKRLRDLANTNKLHIDQWELLENEVKLTLYGFQEAEDLENNIKNEVGVTTEIAHDLAKNITNLVFEPIRQELERELEHPDAHAAKVSGIEAARAEALSNERVGGQSTAPRTPVTPIAPATPPAPAPTQKVERAPVSETYTPNAASHERKTIEGDPYREQLG